MHVLDLFRPPPTRLERLLGRRRVRQLRRRAGFLAMGLGVSLVKPRPHWTQRAGWVALGISVVILVVR